MLCTLRAALFAAAVTSSSVAGGPAARMQFKPRVVIVHAKQLTYIASGQSGDKGPSPAEPTPGLARLGKRRTATFTTDLTPDDTPIVCWIPDRIVRRRQGLSVWHSEADSIAWSTR
jgi:hypothetical protein